MKSFNLSSLNIPEAQYLVLGKLFSHDFIFTSILLNDCNLSSEGKINSSLFFWDSVFDFYHSFTSTSSWTGEEYNM